MLQRYLIAYNGSSNCFFYLEIVLQGSQVSSLSTSYVLQKYDTLSREYHIWWSRWPSFMCLLLNVVGKTHMTSR